MEVDVEHLAAVLVDAQPAEGERDAAGRGVGVERRRVERLRPVRLRRLDADGALAVLDRVVERHVLAHRGVVLAHGLQKALRIHAFELGREFFQRVGADLGHELDAVLGAQQLGHLGVEHLPRELARLLQHLAAVLGVGERVEIPALVDEALALGVDQQAEDVAVLLELVADVDVAELRRVAVPAGGVAARPVAVGRGADVERHLQAVADVEARAAHLGEFPARAEVARAHLGVGLEAAAGEHHRLRAEFDGLALAAGRARRRRARRRR